MIFHQAFGVREYYLKRINKRCLTKALEHIAPTLPTVTTRRCKPGAMHVATFEIAGDNAPCYEINFGGATMRFMVQMVVRLPGDWSADRLDEIGKAETARGHELIKAEKLRRLFRIVGRRANFSIWDADSLEELHENLQSLPMHPWMDITVNSLIEHPSETAFKEMYGDIPPLD